MAAAGSLCDAGIIPQTGSQPERYGVQPAEIQLLVVLRVLPLGRVGALKKSHAQTEEHQTSNCCALLLNEARDLGLDVLYNIQQEALGWSGGAFTANI